MKIGITGASGLIGTALIPRLRAAGHEVVRFVRGSESAPDARRWDASHLEPAAVDDLDAVVHLAGAGVADRYWTRAWKDEVLRSRVEGTTAVARALAEAAAPRILLSASGINYYADTGDRVMDEEAPTGGGFLGEVCRQWETATHAAEQAGVQVAHLRSGIVLSSRGGALKKQLPIFRLGAGAPLGSGRQYVAWISLHDEVRAIEHLLTAKVSGPVNLVSPHPVTNREFTTTLGRVLRRPTLPVPVPGPVLRAVVGGFAEEAVLASFRLTPAVLQRSGFTFAHPHLEEALRASL